ncbi:MAG: O-methyltransferase [Lachnospiraceae bacterium]|jgi:predicted O-methyltransferase YrrM|nr:O-methyltransferase [Lachnospiraceae bacterium]
MLDQERFDIYIDSLSAELPEPLGALEQEALAAGVPIIRKATQSLLAFLLVKDQPKRILEIGTAVGFSALFMKAHLPKDARITTIEKVEMRLVEARKNLEAYDPEGAIALVEGEAQEILNRLAKEQPGSFDFIFMDAAKGQYPYFLPPVLTLLSEDGMLVSDNILQEGDILESRYAVTRRDRTIHSRMREYLYTLTHTPELKTVLLQVGDGVALTVREHQKNREGKRKREKV